MDLRSAGVSAPKNWLLSTNAKIGGATTRKAKKKSAKIPVTTVSEVPKATGCIKRSIGIVSRPSPLA